MPRGISQLRNSLLCALVFVALGMFAAAAQNGRPVQDDNRKQALTLANEGKYLDAYPLLEKLAATNPNDVDVITHFGIAIAARSATLPDAKTRQAERKRAYEILSRAKVLGTKNVMALTFLDQIPPDGGSEDNMASENPEVESALREGEGYFGRGDYERARGSYLRAYNIDPKSYEAALFIGDTYYTQDKNDEAGVWFAKAIAINPDRELAYRYWADALLHQNKVAEAISKFVEAFIAEPYSRYNNDNLDKLASKLGHQFRVITIAPPGTEGFEKIQLQPELLSETDGTKFWQKYAETRRAWATTLFKKAHPDQEYRESLAEHAAALKAVADAASAAMKTGTLKNPHHSIANVMELNQKGLLEAYLLLLTPNEGIAEDYVEYRNKNRDKLRQLLTEYVFVNK